MKKAIKLLSVVALMGLLGMFFCGCDALNYMKSQHGLISDDRQTVSFQGETFKRLPDDVPYYFNSVYSNRVNITDEDVPVLLSEGFSYTSYYDSLNGIMAVAEDVDNVAVEGMYLYDDKTYYFGSTDHFIFFCSEENFDEYSQFKAESADRIGFDDYTEDYNTNVLSSETSKEIFDTIKNGNVMSKDAYEEIIEEATDYIGLLYKCNKSLSLRGAIDGYELNINDDNEVYLLNYFTETAHKLSDKASEEIVREYFGY